MAQVAADLTLIRERLGGACGLAGACWAATLGAAYAAPGFQIVVATGVNISHILRICNLDLSCSTGRRDTSRALHRRISAVR